MADKKDEAQQSWKQAHKAGQILPETMHNFAFKDSLDHTQALIHITLADEYADSIPCLMDKDLNNLSLWSPSHLKIAQREYSKAIHLMPSAMDEAYYKLGILLWKVKDFTEATKNFIIAENIRNTRGEHLSTAIMNYLDYVKKMQSNMTLSEVLTNNAETINQHKALIDIEIGQQYARRKIDADNYLGAIYARTAFERAADTIPHNPKPYYELGQLYLRKGNIDKAAGYFHAARRKGMLLTSPVISLKGISIDQAKIYARFAKIPSMDDFAYRRAIYYFNAAVSSYPDHDNIEAFFERGMLYFWMGEKDKALSDLTKVRELHGTLPDAVTEYLDNPSKTTANQLSHYLKTHHYGEESDEQGGECPASFNK